MSSTSKEPYHTPTLTSIQQMLEVAFATEGNVYRRFHKAADRLGEILDELVALEVEIKSMSEMLDKAGEEVQKLSLMVEVLNKEVERVTLQDQG